MLYALPQGCCRCLGPAERTIEIRNTHTVTKDLKKYTRRYEIQVPICQKCFATVSRYRSIRWWVCGILIGCAVVAILSSIGMRDSDAQLGVLFSGCVLLPLSIMAFMLAASFTEPAEFDQEGRLRFKNKEYQALFDQANSPKILS